MLNANVGICPVCGLEARVSRQWVLNKYGKRYEYLIYHHDGYVHYFNLNSRTPRYLKKGEVENAIIEVISSQQFKLGSFTVGDIKKSLSGVYPDLGYDSIKVSLNRLAKTGLVEKQKSGRNVNWVNAAAKGRLSYFIDSLSIELEDTEGNDLFERHSFLYKITNDRSTPLYYLPFMVLSDIDTTVRELSLSASSLSGLVRPVIVEDMPRYKRLMIRLLKPLLPGRTDEITIRYNLPEPERIFDYSSGTETANFTFTISGSRPLALKVTLTSGTREEVLDLSSNVVELPSERWSHISRLALPKVDAFSALQFRWSKRSKNSG
ncbi:MAG: hypothetical protein M1290_04515 [Candidatus Thermoplasmatota archaeon]|jgi:hypothetical protein|nr:hypothetical protein [Candidatus Thermoplasmatota archaeon]